VGLTTPASAARLIGIKREGMPGGQNLQELKYIR